MTERPTEAHIYAVLREQRLDQKSARRMAQEWLDHYDDVMEAYSDHADSSVVMHIMGSIEQLSAQVMESPLIKPTLVVSGHVTTLGRWTGACTVGMLATMMLFAAMSQLLN